MNRNNTVSPLQQLELQVQASSDDRESIYSFDSVSTNGRLLDRLGLDEDSDLNRRDSMMSVQTTGRLLDRLGLDDSDFSRRDSTLDTFRPTRLHPTMSSVVSERLGRNPNAQFQQRVPNLSQFQSMALNRNPLAQVADKKTVNVKNVVYNHRDSITSFQADITSQMLSSSSGDLAALVDRADLIRSVSTVIQNDSPTIPDTPKMHRQYNSDDDPNTTIDTSQDDDDDAFNFGLSESVLRTPPSRKRSSLRSPSAPIAGELSFQTSPRRVVSDSSPTQLIKSASSPRQSVDLLVESRTKSAIQLRSLGNHREASYQLQICANIPNSYPKAMYLYALALRMGKGVKKNDRHAVKWLCKSILALRLPDTTNINSYMHKLNDYQPEDLVLLIRQSLGPDADPLVALDNFGALLEIQLTKTISNNRLNIVLNAYHELGNAVLNGWGLSKADEALGMSLLAKAGSLGYVDLMLQLGELWSSKSKTHKKDLFEAAAWLRLSELFGAKLIGNSWIYKEKYIGKRKR